MVRQYSYNIAESIIIYLIVKTNVGSRYKYNYWVSPNFIWPSI